MYQKQLENKDIHFLCHKDKSLLFLNFEDKIASVVILVYHFVALYLCRLDVYLTVKSDVMTLRVNIIFEIKITSGNFFI